MKLTFAGVGSAFCGSSQWQTNAFFTNNTGKHLLIDCGGDARFSFAECEVKLADIDSVYITHLHADHIGGMEWLGMCTFFNRTPHGERRIPRPGLYANIDIMHDLWEHSLCGGMDTIEGRVAHLTDYFDCHPLENNEHFRWGDSQGGGIPTFMPIQTVHIMAGYRITHSYGLMIALNPHDTRGTIEDLPGEAVNRIFYTGDTQYCPHQISHFYDVADIIFHDCETVQSNASGVHAHYTDLVKLPARTKRKMWLMHYQQSVDNLDELAKRNSFAGFVKKGQVCDFDEIVAP
jgi:ribonuclease BN (tRNA processing enzyme)